MFIVRCVSAVLRKVGGGPLTTRKHGIACGDIVVEEVEEKQCCKCRGLRGDDATCNGSLAHRKKWARNKPEKVRELKRKYGEEHKEEKNAYNQEL